MASEADKARAALEKVQRKECNRFCADCGTKDPGWASFNLGLFMCIDCSGIHRSIGTHITKIKSCSLDTWKMEWVKVMKAVGNDRANAVWEARLDPSKKPQPDATMGQRESFIRSKYERALWKGDPREAAARKAEDAARADDERAAEEEEKHSAEIQRRMHPRSTEDFEILYNELENWRAHETRRIEEAGLPERERLEALAQLLHKETKLLQTIDRLKIGATKENRERRIARMLELMSEPKKWEMSDGETAQVHTPFSTRAKELQELYSGLNLPMLTVDERLDVLLHVKWTVKEFDCLLTREVVDLIDREADLLNRGRSEKSLEGLRRRISNLFLQFIETPEFNPEAARFQKVPRDLSTRPSVRPVTDSMIRLGKTG
uniref:Arf-GAP domain-containing protein n=1 Tax=Bicosoecida sp. CB-2014 TaxID=1486930 RepID=A0A7S1GAU3_9STRA